MSAPTSIPSASKSARGNINDVDRLSSLCDELLHHVMSFLPTPEVVRTSLLSPRWRNLWACTPFIHIDYQDFEDENNPGCVDFDRMEKFGDNLLILRDAAAVLEEARIYVTCGSSRSKSSVWIRHAIKHKVRLLHVSGSPDFSVLDSTAIFPSQHLKRVRLQSLMLRHGLFRLLNRDCTALEHLELESCRLLDAEISSSSLKVLRIIRCWIFNSLLICARNLTNLSILDPVCQSAIVTRDLSSLVIASVIVSSEKFHYSIRKTVEGHRLLDGLSNATTLELRAPLHELAFVAGLQTCPRFSNLTSLVLGDWCMAADFYPLFRILHHSPKLKELSVKLKMEHCQTCKNAESASLPARRTPPVRGYPCIERIKIYCSKDDPRVGALVQALLPVFIPDGKISIANLCE